MSWSRWKRWASYVRGWRSPAATIASKRALQRVATVSRRSCREAGTRPASSAAIRSSRAPASLGEVRPRCAEVKPPGAAGAGRELPFGWR